MGQELSPEDLPKSHLAAKSHFSLIKILFFLVIAFIGAIAIIFVSLNIKQPLSIINSVVQPSIKKEMQFKQLVNCADTRDLIEEGEKLYVACFGGVLVVDKNSGKVLDQFSMTDGLGNSTTTSLAKKGEMLYVGTQDGFTAFNLTTRAAKKVSVAEGLANGANIILALDGELLWVGTFDGLSLYDTQTEKIINNYKVELADNSNKYNVTEILVTDNAIYTNIVASVESAGSIARFDKKEKKWERFGPSTFLEKIDQYSRIDMMYLKKGGHKVYLSDYHNLWESEDRLGATWKRLDNIVSQLEKGDNNIITLINGEKDLKIIFNSKIYSLLPDADKVNQVYPTAASQANVLKQAQYLTDFQNGQKILLKPINEKEKPWLVWLSLVDNQAKNISLSGRPESIDRVLAVIDSAPIILADGAVWQFETEKEVFEPLLTIESGFWGLIEGSNLAFQPVPGSSQIFVYYQACGMGCNVPWFWLYDYAQRSSQEVKLPEDIKQKIKAGDAPANAYFNLSYDDFDSANKEFHFKMGEEGKEKVNFQVGNLSWQVVPSLDEEKEKNLTAVNFCNPIYVFKSNQNLFKNFNCAKELMNEVYRWEVDTSNYKENIIWQTNQKTGEREKLTLPLTPFVYSPFGEGFYNTNISKVTFDNNYLWVGTNRGLVRYQPQTKEFKLFSVKDGLISNKISTFVVDQKAVWVTTEGGFARLSF